MGWKRSFKHPFNKGYRNARHAGDSIAHATSSATSSVAKTLDKSWSSAGKWAKTYPYDAVSDIIVDAYDHAARQVQAILEDKVNSLAAEVQSRVESEIKQRQSGLVFIGASICFALLGSILLSFAAVYVLIDILKLPVWMSYTSVGGLFAVISMVLLILGRRQLNRPLVSTNCERHTK